MDQTVEGAGHGQCARGQSGRGHDVRLHGTGQTVEVSSDIAASARLRLEHRTTVIDTRGHRHGVGPDPDGQCGELAGGQGDAGSPAGEGGVLPLAGGLAVCLDGDCLGQARLLCLRIGEHDELLGGLVVWVEDGQGHLLPQPQVA